MGRPRRTMRLVSSSVTVRYTQTWLTVGFSFQPSPFRMARLGLKYLNKHSPHLTSADCQSFNEPYSNTVFRSWLEVSHFHTSRWYDSHSKEMDFVITLSLLGPLHSFTSLHRNALRPPATTLVISIQDTLRISQNRQSSSFFLFCGASNGELAWR
ncbi:hypothetical protein BD410DRAFT_793010 [Rickenella mellea]|uniref:Uncharacterized protein n=1 Tax=Rickenella mellea TaxID=50990 RepID=A0A4Y7PT94_9AGAM|nr:hypothetical protein BD410DRAFT_793010 [Rickenella mellea]